MDQPLSMTGSDTGNDLSPSHQLSVMYNLEWVLEQEVRWQNHLTSLKIANAEDDMREVKALGSSLRDMMDKVKKSAADAQANFQTEAERALSNSDKVKSAAADLKAANLEIESFLGEADSNFPPSEESPPVTPHPVEFHGTTLVLKE